MLQINYRAMWKYVRKRGNIDVFQKSSDSFFVQVKRDMFIYIFFFKFYI